MGVEAEVANAETERGTEGLEEELKSMREEDTTAAIHGGFTRQMRGGNRFHTESNRTRESSPKGRRNTGMEDGLMIRKDAVWCSPVVAGGFTQVHSPHACTVTLINTSNTNTLSSTTCMKTLWLQQRLQEMKPNQIAERNNKSQ